MISPNSGEDITSIGLHFRYHLIAVLILFIPHKTISLHTCPTHYCSGEESDAPAIRFPFIAIDTKRSRRCGYPGFNLTCKTENQHPIITLPSSGDFVVQLIDYVNQVILVGDPNNCLPKRIMNLDLTGSPFSGSESRNHTFLNCTNGFSSSAFMAMKVPCLSGVNHTVYATFLDSSVEEMVGSGKCRVMKSVWSPSLWPNYNDDSGPDLDRAVMELRWDVPDCRDCELRDGSCGFSDDSGLEIGCSVSTNSTHGASKIVKYGLILGLGIPGFMLVVGLTFYFSGKIRSYNQRRRQLAHSEFSPSIFPQSAMVMVGLDGQTIESYPKTLLGESGRLPNPSDALCAICLSEYEAKETLRTIPECNHYFHAQCIDEWLRLKGTCPLCRNSPGK